MPNKRLLPIIVTVADRLKRHGRGLPRDLDARITAATKNGAYYEQVLFQAVEDRYNEKITDFAFLLLFSSLMLDATRRAYEDGLRDAGYNGDLTGEMEMELTQAQREEESHMRDLLAAILIAIAAGAGVEVFRNRIALWSNRYNDLTNRARVTGSKRSGRRLMWVVGPTEHCTDCNGYNGQVKTAWEWDYIFSTTGHRPQSPALECKGYRCQCGLRVV